MKSRFFVFFLLAILTLTVVNVPISLAERPDAPPYAKRGGYFVGTRELRIEDEQRPLDVAIWYPALNPDKLPLQAQYIFLAFSTTGRALRDAAIDPSDRYPLIVFSHGLSGAKYQSLYYVEHLASHGFVVIAADHPGSTFGSITTDSIAENFALRPDDMLRQITLAESLNTPAGWLSGAVNLERIGVTGHSFGGYTALSVGGAALNFAELDAWCRATTDPALDAQGVCGLLESQEEIAASRGLVSVPTGNFPLITDARIKAILLQAPSTGPAFGRSGLAIVSAPTMVIVGSKDRATIPEQDAYPIYDGIGSSNKVRVVLQNANHYIFVDKCIPALILIGQYKRCSDEVWDMDRAHDLINHFSTAFFLATLKEDVTALEALQPSAVDFIGVDYSAAMNEIPFAR